MTLSDKIQLVNDLIRENSEITIAEYLDALQEIEIIERVQEDLAFAEELDRIRQAPKIKSVAASPAEPSNVGR